MAENYYLIQTEKIIINQEPKFNGQKALRKTESTGLAPDSMSSLPVQCTSTSFEGTSKASEHSMIIKCIIITETSVPEVFDALCITIFHNSLQKFTFLIYSRLVIILTISSQINSH